MAQFLHARNYVQPSVNLDAQNFSVFRNDILKIPYLVLGKSFHDSDIADQGLKTIIHVSFNNYIATS